MRIELIEIARGSLRDKQFIGIRGLDGNLLLGIDVIGAYCLEFWLCYWI